MSDFVPKKTHAFVIRPEFHGPPLQEMKREVVDVPDIVPAQVLVHVLGTPRIGAAAAPIGFQSRPPHMRPR